MKYKAVKHCPLNYRAVKTEPSWLKHKPIRTEFVWTGDGFGAAYARHFRQLKRVGDVAIYERTVEKTGRIDGYEVIKISRHNGYTLGGQYVAPAETYPGSSQFGKSAWSCVDLAHAEMVFNKRLAESKVKDSQEAAAKASGIVIKRRGRPRKVQS